VTRRPPIFNSQFPVFNFQFLAFALGLLSLLAPQSRAATSSGYAIAKGVYCPNRISTPHFALEFSADPDDGAEYAALCERAYRHLSRVFTSAKGGPVWSGKCQVYLFATHAEFVRFAWNVHKSAAGVASGGYTRISKKDPAIVLFLREDDAVMSHQTLVHEMTHVFLGLFYKAAPLPTWVQEGCAQYFEFRYVPSRSRLALARQTTKKLVETGRYAPLREFSGRAFGPTDLPSYCQAWSLLDFLINGKAGSPARASQFIVLLKDGKPQDEALRVAYGTDFPRLEAAWKEYVLATYRRPLVLPRDDEAALKPISNGRGH